MVKEVTLLPPLLTIHCINIVRYPKTKASTQKVRT